MVCISINKYKKLTFNLKKSNIHFSYKINNIFIESVNSLDLDISNKALSKLGFNLFVPILIILVFMWDLFDHT